ncbi:MULTISPECIES: class I SAM-dependent methyltransferase [unclassified Dysgonomonas]|uniref:class I SAM-dependent methyltransferase n=1 Tax=unclassified Dysgonomonas TaxID=2630389 RepID=UPI00067FB909|nr:MULTISPECIES: class I SAM-dependent methyltransferase [unclassified Dysgonomonas]MBD8349393.1 class I SAM-dependent methyltransferase [Dysgonomonas sp. HGC4]MBF0578005.1 class I SAM-dependent methyltransferase [Dysgonomonas sp. GY617]
MQNADYYSFDRKEIFPFIPQNIEKTLDVGCAAGVFSNKLKKERNPETWGIEMQKEAAEIAKTRLDKVLIGSFDEVSDDLPQQYFDCVFFNDVLEHMPYPETCLTKIKANVHPKGKIIASIPNMRHIEVLRELLFQKDWKYKDSGILDRTHLRFFTKKSIIRMFKDCGYKIDLIKGINSVSPYCLTSILSKLSLNSLDDIKHKQFIIVASPI